MQKLYRKEYEQRPNRELKIGQRSQNRNVELNETEALLSYVYILAPLFQASQKETK